MRLFTFAAAMTNPKINFTPGPSQLYFTVADHMRTAFREGIPSLSHRSKQFENIYKDTVDGLRELLGLPDHFHVFFTGSATEIWERTIQNLVLQNSVHLVNGSFSKRFYEVALQLNKKALLLEAPAGSGFEFDVQIPGDTELIALTHNETSTGVALPLNFISAIREQNPSALMVIDAVSSLPHPDFDYADADAVFFSVQKGFGLPAGLGVWLVNDRCIEKAETLLSKGNSIGSYHNIPSLLQHERKFQTPETPNVLAIYLLSKVVADMIRRGIGKIRKETEYKAAILYQALEKHAAIGPFVSDAPWRSQTVIVADTGNLTGTITETLLRHGMQPGDGYGGHKKTQLRFANFPTHAKEHFELLVDLLDKL